MAELRIGWHPVLFPTEGTSGAEFMAQLDSMLSVIEDRFDSVWIDDHLLPWADFVAPETPALECLTTIAYLAGRHPAIDFGSFVLCQAYRNPALVAKMAANLQFLTGGRFILGMGAGWMEKEYHAYGYAFPAAKTRIAQLAEAVKVVRTAWSDGSDSFEGRFYSVSDIVCRPLLDPPPPILIGGGGEKLTLRVVAEQADWCNFGGTPESYGHKLDVLKTHCEDVGRDYNEIVKSYASEVVAVAETESEARRLAEAAPFSDVYPIVGNPEQVAALLRPIVDLGVEHLILRFVDFPSVAGAELFADVVAPLLRGDDLATGP